jgi:MFS family permease
LDLSGSTALTGVANALLLLPYLLQVVAGPIVDRLRIKPVLVGTQVVQGVVVLVVPLAAHAGHLSVRLVIAVIPVLSLMTLLLSPIPSTLLPRIVADHQLSKSNSALATVTLGLDMVFDAVGGFLVAAVGATTLILFDSVTFAVAATLFAGMVIPAVDEDDPTEESTPGERADDADDSPLSTYVADLRDGIDALRGTVFVPMLSTAAVSNLAVGVTLAVLPGFGKELGGAAVYGLLLGALGVGRLLGSVSASRLDGVRYGVLTAGTYLVAAALWLGSVYAPTPPLTVVLFGLAWIAGGIDGVLTRTLNQRVFPAALLGRISSIKGTASTATLPVGSLVGGVVAELIGVSTTMALAAGGFGFVGAVFALHPRLRGLPPVADAEPADFDVSVDGSSATESGDAN